MNYFSSGIGGLVGGYTSLQGSKSQSKLLEHQLDAKEAELMYQQKSHRLSMQVLQGQHKDAQSSYDAININNLGTAESNSFEIAQNYRTKQGLERTMQTAQFAIDNLAKQMEITNLDWQRHNVNKMKYWNMAGAVVNGAAAGYQTGDMASKMFTGGATNNGNAATSGSNNASGNGNK